MTPPIDYENPFTAEDLESVRRCVVNRDEITDIDEVIDMVTSALNSRFREILAGCPTVVKCNGMGHHDAWLEDYDGLDGPPTHEAKLWRPKEIGK